MRPQQRPMLKASSGWTEDEQTAWQHASFEIWLSNLFVFAGAQLLLLLTHLVFDALGVLEIFLHLTLPLLKASSGWTEDEQTAWQQASFEIWLCNLFLFAGAQLLLLLTLLVFDALGVLEIFSIHFTLPLFECGEKESREKRSSTAKTANGHSVVAASRLLTE
jgi:hypothetical protein